MQAALHRHAPIALKPTPLMTSFRLIPTPRFEVSARASRDVVPQSVSTAFT
jgi:hypothetical protein